jgi:hypothetical protein
MPFYKIYKALLWLMGFESGEFITYLWRRQAKRLGVLWWLLVASTQGIAVVFLDNWTSAWRMLIQIVVCLLIAVIFWHVATGTTPD